MHAQIQMDKVMQIVIKIEFPKNQGLSTPFIPNKTLKFFPPFPYLT